MFRKLQTISFQKHSLLEFEPKTSTVPLLFRWLKPIELPNPHVSYYVLSRQLINMKLTWQYVIECVSKIIIHCWCIAIKLFGHNFLNNYFFKENEYKENEEIKYNYHNRT